MPKCLFAERLLLQETSCWLFRLQLLICNQVEWVTNRCCEQGCGLGLEVSVSRQSRELTTSRLGQSAQRLGLGPKRLGVSSRSRAISCRWSRCFVRRARSVAQYSRRRPIQTNLPYSVTTPVYTYTRLTAFFPGLPGWASTRKVKRIWILLKQETVSGNGISWATCKSAPRSRQTTTPVPHHSVFYRPDALPAVQPTVLKHWRQ